MKRLSLSAASLLVTALVAMALAPGLARAAQVAVKVSGIATADGQIGCSLFAAADGFPMDSRSARQLWLPASRDGATCAFDDVADGRYAISVAHDLNGNRKVDTNFVGVPTEAWGVSGNARPTLRAPKWDEASFSVSGGRDVVLEVRVAK